MSKKDTHNPLKGALYGFITGGVSGAIMDGYWALVKKLPGARPEQKPKGKNDGQNEDQPSTQIIADKVSEALTGEEIPRKHKPLAGIGVHYGTSVAFGALYGVVAARRPKLGPIAGAIYGAAIWLFLDEITLRVLKIGPKPEKVPTNEHIQALGAHLVYGSATGALTRIMLR
ncbi:MAG TPA: DUF1440 domain-containing protein [Chloroflexia bacterium]|nr:DUF1440 domain-containing protein [Chloroflexia bacterium]